jgi:aspartokinase/homoserine dehydrogenase 1
MKSPVKGISNINDIALLTLQGNGMVGIPGFSKRLFETLAQEKINIILITQASSEHSICFGINESEAEKAKLAVDKTFENEIALHKIDPIHLETGLSIVAIVGDNMKNHQGISGKMFSALGKNNVNIRAIAQGASERNISAAIDKKDVKKALNTLHERFFEVKTKQINLFIAGVGNVGERIIEQINQQSEFVKEQLHVNLRIVGLSNSRKMVFDENGIKLNSWKDQLETGIEASLDGFLTMAKKLNLRNSVFVDITANEDVANMYGRYLRENIAIVACNKIAVSNDYDNYFELKQLSRKYNVPFLYETNVGAGLPVIDTLNHLITSGDRVHSIQAVLSGSLNFVFNNFNSNNRFHDIVKQAQEEGYTEPDPRIDLSGIDVARKILILARESGTQMNLEDINCANFLTEAAMNAVTVPEFFETLKQDEDYYQGLYASADKNNCQLKFVAEFSDGKAKVGLKEIPQGHPFYNLKGKDNIVMFYTNRYPENPLIIKGAGAGADVTASGLFADIIRIANN